MKIVILIVLYKQKIIDSRSYQSLQKILNEESLLWSNYELVFWDNSPAEVNQKYIEKIKKNMQIHGLLMKYINTPQNIALSEIYNTTLDIYEKTANYLCIFDQDSIFGSDYLHAFNKAIKSCEYDILLPLVKFKEKFVSPTKIYYLKGFYFDSPPNGAISIRNLSAINSGMIISLKFTLKHHYRYNNKIRNYCTDDNIMMFMRKNNAKVFILDYIMEHDLSFCTLNDNSDSLRYRYIEMLKAKKILYSRNIFERMLVGIYFTIHKIYMAIKYKEIKYFKG
ncbi:hypothetical protein EDWATA_01323 [Edwardsiella tarda ATCC 23685]|uniref:Glycosyltransferase 2-like domain-containing protein n=1 Tax=Edwardsiella tarda ATCC 23685 TaxID=500638 RepID=D4F3L3_EDWTA|nr:hypothetical protein [Edwardsiella tarda]EFE23634.1 hypothetical protein EDWATA_01323 [Edwardsiella tarda ATCC 23685]STD47364.1 Uncharacterised protein [Edwardsiella tarda]